MIEMTAKAPSSSASSAFIWRRVHSLMGLWLIVYLIEHLIVNSQAALWIGDDGIGFVRLVNLLESLPYLQAIEILFIGVPLAIHGIWGVKRALTAKTNSFKVDGHSPGLPYPRNRAFTWQRATSWILLFGIVAHVVQMRFLNYPKQATFDHQKQYLTVVGLDEGLYTLAPRVGVTLYGPEQIAVLQTESGNLAEKLSAYRLKENQVVVAAPSPGKAMLFMIRDAFKNPLTAVLYSIFVIAAAFHAFNGFWTALITWGAILSYRSQKAMLPIGWLGILFLCFLGLASIWGSYWINLRN
jgi:succinate dehydrogenase / fumarate reductase cytochrome b subunit